MCNSNKQQQQATDGLFLQVIPAGHSWVIPGLLLGYSAAILALFRCYSAFINLPLCGRIPALFWRLTQGDALRNALYR
jgi:hypothetical protein